MYTYIWNMKISASIIFFLGICWCICVYSMCTSNPMFFLTGSEIFNFLAVIFTVILFLHLHLRLHFCIYWPLFSPTGFFSLFLCLIYNFNIFMHLYAQVRPGVPLQRRPAVARAVVGGAPRLGFVVFAAQWFRIKVFMCRFLESISLPFLNVIS